MKTILIVGGGAAGMMAAYAAAKEKQRVILLEKNEKLGKKLYITGKGRCNITNASDMENLFANVVSNRKFLYSAFYTFDNMQVLSFFEENGLELKTERGNRVFPASDHSSDVIVTLVKVLKKLGVEIHLNTEVKELLLKRETSCDGTQENKVCGVLCLNGEKIQADAVLVATGGMSYQATGSTGDGYRFAGKAGHKVTELYPSLVPYETKEKWVKELQGLSLRNSAITIWDEKKKLYEDFGEMLFTHFGVSGPMILSASGSLPTKYKGKELRLEIDLKPALEEEQLDKRILRDFEEMKNKQFKNSLQQLLPSKLIPIIIELSGIDPDKQVNEVSKEERLLLVQLIKHFKMTLTKTREWKEAIITKGGVAVKEINPSTMESKLVKGMYFCGEVLDLDALTGGYNLQIAWSTGYVAGKSAAEET